MAVPLVATSTANMPQTISPSQVVYHRDGRSTLLLDAEDVELAQLYLKEQSTSISEMQARKNVIQLFIKNGASLGSACDIVSCAWGRNNNRYS